MTHRATNIETGDGGWNHRPQLSGMGQVAIDETGDLESSILERLGRGDQSAVSECVENYGPLIWSIARKLSPTLSDAEDAVQEIFVDLWQTASQYRSEIASETTFIAMIARRRLIDRHRRRSNSLNTSSLGNDNAVARDVPPEAQFEMRDEAAKAARCLDRLPEESRQVLRLSIQQGVSQTRIAEQMRLPLGSVKSISRRSLIRLRECMNLKSVVSADGGVR